MHTAIFEGNDVYSWSTLSGTSFQLTLEEMQSMFEQLREMDALDHTTPAEVSDLEKKVSDLESEIDDLEKKVSDLESEIDDLERKEYMNDDYKEKYDDLRRDLKQKLNDIVEEL